MTVHGRHVLVTGGGNGIGAAIVAALTARGATVSSGDLDGAAAAAVAAAAPGPGTAFGGPLDVTDPESYQRFLDEATARSGPVDVLVSNAGVMWVGPFDAESDATLARQLAVNVGGVVRGARLVAPGMRERRRGQVVVLASAASKVSPAGESTYAATKHAVYGYCTGLRAELRGSGVRVSVVMPSVVETALAAGTSHGRVRRLQPQDVAAAVVRVIERPRDEVYVPGWLAALFRLRELLPPPAYRAMTRLMVPDQVRATAASARKAYERSTFGGADG